MDKITAEKVLNIKDNPYTKDILQKCYKSAVKRAHPDCGGSHELMVQVNEAHTYLLSYFKHQNFVSLSAQTSYKIVPDYQKEINKQEQCYEEIYDFARNEPNRTTKDNKENTFIWHLAIILRLAFFIFSCIMFISIGSWDFILNFGTFHFMDYWGGDFLSFILCVLFLIAGAANVGGGFLTDHMAVAVWLIKDAWEKKKA